MLDIGADDVLFSASAGARRRTAREPGEIHVYRVAEHGVARVSDEPGVHSAVAPGGR